MEKYYPAQTNKDHVLVNITLSVMIGVDETEDDTPSDFCNRVREGIKQTTGGIIIASSIVAQKRINYLGSAREMLFKASGIKHNPLHNGEDDKKEK